MAVFLVNICKYNGCGIIFPSLGDLIQHIEDKHIDYDPKVVEQKEQAQPACLPLSYVLRFISDAAPKEAGAPFGANNTGVDIKRKLAIKHHSYSMSSSNRSNTPTGSEMDEDEMIVSESEDSNDSWTTEEFSSEFIMRYGSRHSGAGGNGIPGNEKPFACPVPGCKKRYKNVNGIKYHSKNGHKKDGKVRKGYKCHCGKSYKTPQGLKNHALAAHNSTSESIILTSNNITGLSGNVQRCATPSFGSVSPSSNMSNSNSSCNGSNNTGFATNLHGLPTVIANNSSIATITSNGGVSNYQQQHMLKHQQKQNLYKSNDKATLMHHQQTVCSTESTGTGGLISMKPNATVPSAAASSSTKPSTTSNLIAANMTANKILKLATSAASAANPPQSHVQIQQQQQLLPTSSFSLSSLSSSSSSPTSLSSSTSPQSNSTSTKVTLPNLVNLGILTPATSPTKATQSVSYASQQHQLMPSISIPNQQQQKQLQSQLLVGNSNVGKMIIVDQKPQQQQLPLTPISPGASSMGPSKSVAVGSNSQHQMLVSGVHLATTNATCSTQLQNVLTTGTEASSNGGQGVVMNHQLIEET